MTTKRLSIVTFLAVVFMLIFTSGHVAAQQQDVQGLENMTIRNEQGEEIGTVKEVVTGPDGNIEAVIIQKGGFMGLGGEEERISWNDLQMGADRNYLVYMPGAQADEQVAAQRYQTEQQERAGMEQPQQQQEQAAGQRQQAMQQRREPGREGQAGGEIIVEEGAPQVRVDQSQPEVQVEQPSPQVSVEQPRPDVSVKQPPPEITVQVEQPKPQVDVQQQQPQVQVQQPEPEVSVSQARPDVQVRQQEPEISVEKSEPEVQVGQGGQPEVFVEKQGQAQVDVEQVGEPEVKVLHKEAEAGKQEFGRVEVSKAQDWVGRVVTGENGEELGTVESNYLTEDRNYVLYLIVQGEEDRMHPIPAGMVEEVQGEKDLRAEIDKSAFDQSPSFSATEQPQLNEQQWSQEIRAYYGKQRQGDQSRQQEQGGQSPQSR